MMGRVVIFDDNPAHVKTAQVLDGMLYTISKPYTVGVAEGDVPNHYPFSVQGYNPDIDNTEETVAPVGGIVTYPATAAAVEIICASTQDYSTGYGVKTLEIHYLDGNFAEKSITVNSPGVTAAATIVTDIYRIQRVHVSSVGTAGAAVGTIQVRHISDTPVYAYIAAGRTGSEAAMWTVPAGYTAYITQITVGVGNATGNRYAEFRLKAESERFSPHTYSPGLFRTHTIIALQDSAHTVTYSSPIVVPQYATIRVDALSDAANADARCTAFVEGWYEAN